MSIVDIVVVLTASVKPIKYGNALTTGQKRNEASWLQTVVNLKLNRLMANLN
jgi:hypothetical protein